MSGDSPLQRVARKRRERRIQNVRQSDRRSWPFDVLTIVGPILALAGTLGAAGLAYYGASEGNLFSHQSKICEQAYAVLGDESPNPYLSKAQAQQLVASQLRIADRCAKEGE